MAFIHPIRHLIPVNNSGTGGAIPFDTDIPMHIQNAMLGVLCEGAGTLAVMDLAGNSQSFPVQAQERFQGAQRRILSTSTATPLYIAIY